MVFLQIVKPFLPSEESLWGLLWGSLAVVSRHLTNTNKLMKQLQGKWYPACNTQSSVWAIRPLHKLLPLDQTEKLILYKDALLSAEGEERYDHGMNKILCLWISWTFFVYKGIVEFRVQAVQPGTQALYEPVPGLAAPMQGFAAQQQHHTKVTAVLGYRLVFCWEVHNNSLASVKVPGCLRWNCTAPSRDMDLDTHIFLLSIPQV